ncbi:MAG: lipoprotein [Phycisphaerae bacterium]|nr:MAG: lipoprotein [Phycisphaerae bacterium]
MIVPGRAMIFIASAIAFGLPVAVFRPELLGLAILCNVLLILLFGVYALRLKRTRVLVEREQWTRLELDCYSELVYRIENASPKRVIVNVRQAWPKSFETDTELIEVALDPYQVVRAAVTVTPHRRGRIDVPTANVDVRFGLDVARRRWAIDEETTMSVYPNLRTVARYDALKRHRALHQIGIHQRRQRGAGREFDQLREYLPDDDYRNINWMATARNASPIVNVYQPERSQDVLVCLETGRMMGNPIGNTTALDRAVDASMMLSHVCSRAGDRLGLVLFRDTVTQFIRPSGSPAIAKRVMESLVDVSAEGVFPSYAALVSALRANQKKRSMIFLFTDLNDPQLAANLRDVLPLVSRRHIFVVVSLFDQLMDRVASGPAPDRKSLYQIYAARRLVEERQTRLKELTRAGVQVLQVDVSSISIDVINTYLSIKSRQLL